jgi:hypothetical protein
MASPLSKPSNTTPPPSKKIKTQANPTAPPSAKPNEKTPPDAPRSTKKTPQKPYETPPRAKTPSGQQRNIDGYKAVERDTPAKESSIKFPEAFGPFLDKGL